MDMMKVKSKLLAYLTNQMSTASWHVYVYLCKVQGVVALESCKHIVSQWLYARNFN